METPDFEHGIVYFKQFGAERVSVTAQLAFSTMTAESLIDPGTLGFTFLGPGGFIKQMYNSD